MGITKILDYDGEVWLYEPINSPEEWFSKIRSETSLTQETYSFGGKEVL